MFEPRPLKDEPYELKVSLKFYGWADSKVKCNTLDFNE